MSQQINARMGAFEWFLLLALSVLWGGSFFFVGVAVDSIPPLTLVVLRVGLAALALHIVILALGKRMPGDIRTWSTFASMGLLNNVVPFSLIVWGQTHIASGLASILNGLTPLFTVVVAHICLHDEKMNSDRTAGVLIGLAGAILVIGPGALRGLADNAGGIETWSQLAVAAAAVSYAFAGVYGRRFKRDGLEPLVIATGQVTASTAILLPVALALEQPWGIMNAGVVVWSSVAALAVASTALAYIIYFRLLATAGAVNLMLTTLLIPATAILLGNLVLDERLSGEQFAGLAIIACGLVVLDGRVLRRHRTN